MHEYSLIRALIGQVDQALRDHAGDEALCEVRVELGPWLCAEPALLQTAFRGLAAARWPQATLHIEQPPALAHCPACRCDVELPGLAHACPRCGAVEIELRSGDQFVLTELVLGAVESET
ncbi:MAG: hydrogenase maturation nickel metallochaperone HypA [Pirellulales bacterium]|nr:hydrogenase maturation nickel metallochaperone HypA [Pirellulales bacterium]